MTTSLISWLHELVGTLQNVSHTSLSPKVLLSYFQKSQNVSRMLSTSQSSLPLELPVSPVHCAQWRSPSLPWGSHHSEVTLSSTWRRKSVLFPAFVTRAPTWYCLCSRVTSAFCGKAPLGSAACSPSNHKCHPWAHGVILESISKRGHAALP